MDRSAKAPGDRIKSRQATKAKPVPMIKRMEEGKLAGWIEGTDLAERC